MLYLGEHFLNKVQILGLFWIDSDGTQPHKKY